MNFRLLSMCIFILVISFESSNSLNRRDVYTETFLSRINQFSAEFYEVLAKNEKGNFISSPISVLMVLAMAACGAKGTTRRELIQALHLPMENGFRLIYFRRFINNLNMNSDTTNIELHLANKLFVDDNFNVEWVFDHITNYIFQSQMESLDFNDAFATANTINEWCSKKTNNKIRSLLEADDLTGAQMVMVNAVYFKGNWVHPFSSDLEQRIFNLSKNNSVTIPMMCTDAEYNYGPIPKLEATYIELPYKAGDSKRGFSMFIILPDKINGVNEIGNKLHEINFMKLHAPKTTVNLCMPKFKIETELDLKLTLQNMGIHDMFKSTADFSNISPNSNLTIDKAIQKAFINVDEKGSEAAAVTGLLGFRFGGDDVIVDRPYISAIVSKVSGTPLFWARVNDPRL